ncbi:MAG: carbohydrate ABC transporter permease [Propionibacteriaceae bacterium]|jgi:cellobiose transport system permease protein|nr:carbohydrate ABC transporter permease [Propionibacteriaceae bacterium]
MSRETSMPALRQTAPPSVVRAAAKRRRLAVTSEGRKANWFTYAVLAFVILISVFPLYYAVQIASVTTDNMYGWGSFGTGSLALLGEHLRIAFGELNWTVALLNTILVSGVCAISVVFFSTLAGYSFAKLRFRGKAGLFGFIIATMAIPTQLSVVPLYILMSKLGLYGKLEAVIIPGLVTAFGVFWMTQYLEQALPYELIEAARVDGCSMIRTFWHVALPAARPAASMLALFTFVAQWTQYYWPFLVLGSNNRAVLTVAASTLAGGRYTDYTLIMSGVVLTSFPLVLLFVFVGKQLVAGIMAGAVKG